MITVAISLLRFRDDARRVRRVLVKAILRLTKRQVHVGVFLISDTEMRTMNRVHRRKDKATNVLSFAESARMPHPDLPKVARVLGEIFLAPDFIARKSEDLEALAVHGLLHLFGYTHTHARDRIEMETKEQELYGLHDNRIGRRLEHGTRRGRRKHA